MFVSESSLESPRRFLATRPHITTSSLYIYPFLRLQILHHCHLLFISPPQLHLPLSLQGQSRCSDKSEVKRVGSIVQCDVSSYFSPPPPSLLFFLNPRSLAHTVIPLRYLTEYPLSHLSFSSPATLSLPWPLAG